MMTGQYTTQYMEIFGYSAIVGFGICMTVVLIGIVVTAVIRIYKNH